MKIVEDQQNVALDDGGGGCGQPLIDVAKHAVATATDNNESINVVDVAQVKANWDRFLVTHPDVEPVVDVAALNVDLLAFLNDIGVGIFSAKNKAEIQRAVEGAGIDPKALAFLNPFKPASQIKYAMSQGIKTFGCGSAAEVAKIVKAKRVLDLEEGDALNIVVMVDASNVAPLEILLDLVQSAKQHFQVIGVALYDDSGETSDSLDAFTKAVATARLLFEVIGEEGMKVFDLGEMLTDEKEDYLRQREAILTSQFHSLKTIGDDQVQIMAHVGHQILENAAGLVVPIQAVRHEDDHSIVVIAESIYGAFSGIFAGDEKIGQNPVLIPASIVVGTGSTTESVCDVLGGSGNECDVIASGARIQGASGARLGDWMLFPNVSYESSSVQLVTSAWIPTDDDISDISELENLFRLPDLTDENLESMFNI